MKTKQTKTTMHLTVAGRRRGQSGIDAGSMPVLVHDGDVFFADLQRGVFVEVASPHRAIGFDSPLGQAIAGEPLVTHCPRCEAYQLVGLADLGHEAQCSQCHRSFHAEAAAGWPQ